MRKARMLSVLVSLFAVVSFSACGGIEGDEETNPTAEMSASLSPRQTLSLYTGDSASDGGSVAKAKVYIIVQGDTKATGTVSSSDAGAAANLAHPRGAVIAATNENATSTVSSSEAERTASWHWCSSTGEYNCVYTCGGQWVCRQYAPSWWGWNGSTCVEYGCGCPPISKCD